MGELLPHPRSRSGFTLIEVLVALLLVAILTTAGVIAFAPAQEAPVRVVLAGDLDTFAALEAKVFHERGRYDEPGDVVAGPRMTLSPGVEVDSSAFSPERVYLRVRHQGSPERCSIDLSAASRTARNRVQCFGGTGRDSSESVPIGDGEERPVADTTAAKPAAEVIPQAVVVAPDIREPSDVTVQPGSAVDQTFLLTNRGATARIYSLAFSSTNPAVVSLPADPPATTVPAGATVGIRFASSLAAETQAGRLSAITLEAVDVSDPSLIGRGTFAALAAVRLAAPVVAAPPAVKVAPGDSVTLRWDVSNESNVARMIEVALPAVAGSLALQAAEGIGRVRFEPGEKRQVAGRYVLRAPSSAGSAHGVTLSATDAADPSLSGTSRAGVTTALLLVAPDLVVPADTVVGSGGTVTRTWEITGRTNATRSYRVVHQVAGPAVESVLGGPGVVELAEGATVRIAVTYSVRQDSRAGAASTLQLTVSDDAVGVERGGTSMVAVGLSTAAPKVTGPGAVSGYVGDTATMFFRIHNGGNGDRRMALQPASSSNAVALAAAATEVEVPAFGSVTVPVLVRFAPGPVESLNAEVSLQVSDLAEPALSGTASGSARRLNRSPTVKLTGPAGDVVAGEWVRFAVAGGDLDGDDVALELEMGDGASMHGVAQVDHAFAAPGTYFVRAKAVDRFGGVGEEVLPVHVVAATIGCMDPGASNYNPNANVPGDCTYGPSLVKTELMVRIFICDYEQGFNLFQIQDTWGRLYDYWSDGTVTPAGDAYQMSYVTLDLGPSGAAPYGLICERYKDDWP